MMAYVTLNIRRRTPKKWTLCLPVPAVHRAGRWQETDPINVSTQSGNGGYLAAVGSETVGRRLDVFLMRMKR